MNLRLIFPFLFMHLMTAVHAQIQDNPSEKQTSTPDPLEKTNDVKYTISGYIKEKGSQEHLPTVSIYIPKLGIGTATNTYGFYSLTVPEGNHEIVISYIGYQTITKKINLTTDLNLNVDIEIATESLDEIVINSEKVIKESQVTQMSIVTIKPSDIEDVPMFLGEKDVLKTLQLLPGIQSGNEASSGLFVRGGTPDQNLIILDEATVYNSNHLFGFFSVFNGDAIKSVEAFKGGFPARFGGRLSSVIKIDMKDGNKEKLSGKVNIGLISSSLLLEGPINKGKTSFLFSGRRTYADVLSKPFQKKDFKVGYFFHDLNFKIHHVFNEKNKLFWSNYYGQDAFSTNDKGDFGNFETKLGWGNVTSTLRWNHQFNKKLFSNTSLIYSNYNFTANIKEKFEEEEFEFKTSSGINDFGLKSDFEYYPNPNHDIRFGLTTTRHSFVPRRVAIKVTRTQDVNNQQQLNSFESAVYLEDNWSISSRFNISPGVRLSHFSFKSLNYFKPEPRITLAWKATPDLSIKTSYSKMNQFVHLLSNSGVGLPTDLWVSSTEKVKPQVAEQVALGLAKDFGNTGYSINVEGYYKKMDNVIAYKEGASFLAIDDLETGKDLDWENNITSGQGWAYGAEFLFRKQRGKLTGWLGYTLSWSERQFDEINLGRKFNAKYDRRHDISLVSIYKPSKKITLSGSWVFSSGSNYTLPSLETIPVTTKFPIPIFGESKFATERNNFRGESSHRLDLGIQWHKNTKRNRERTWGLFIYNTYANRNPFFYHVANKTRSRNIGEERIVLNRVAVLVFVPSFSYTLKF